MMRRPFQRFNLKVTGTIQKMDGACHLYCWGTIEQEIPYT